MRRSMDRALWFNTKFAKVGDRIGVSSIFVASFVGSLVDNVRDKARDKVYQVAETALG